MVLKHQSVDPSLLCRNCTFKELPVTESFVYINVPVHWRPGFPFLLGLILLGPKFPGFEVYLLVSVRLPYLKSYFESDGFKSDTCGLDSCPVLFVCLPHQCKQEPLTCLH